jgi:uncharacterized caspase-like protein
MKKRNKAASFCVVAFLVLVPGLSQAKAAEARLALVIGNAEYGETPLATAANDAGLIAQTLSTAGFDVTGAANLDQDSLRRAFRDLIAKVKAAGPHTMTFVYLSGYGLQFAGENYLVPIDASLQRDTDIPSEAIRVSDFTHALAGLPIDARVFVLDAARANPFPVKGSPLASGLALVDAEDGSLYALNAAPGTVAPNEPGPYGAYAQALAEMLRYGGIPLDESFARTRLRTNELSHGAFVPWDVSKLNRPIILLAGNPEAAGLPPRQNYAAFRSRPIRDYPSAGEAYAAALELDTLSAYQEFLSAYPSDPLARRVRALLAARREALTWNQTLRANSADAYWSYMRRYPRGPHFYDARRRLAVLSAPLEPPPRFDAYDFQGLPPPPEDEVEIIDRPYIVFDGRDYPPPPPLPDDFLPPPPREFRRLPPPEEHQGYLPAPLPLPLPFARPVAEPGRVDQPDMHQPDMHQPGQGPRPGGAPPVGQAGEQPGPGGRPAGPPNISPTGPIHTLPGTRPPAPEQPGGHPVQGLTPPPAPGALPQVNPQAPVPHNESNHPARPGPAAPSNPHALPESAQPSGAPPEAGHAPHAAPEALPHPEPTHAAPGLAPHVAPAEAPHAAPPVQPHPEPVRPALPAPPHVAPPPEAPHAAPSLAPHAAPPVQPRPEPARPAPQAAPHVVPPPEAPHAAPPVQARPEPARPAPQAAPHVEPPHAEPPHAEPPHAAPPPAAPKAEAPKDPRQQHPLKPGEAPGEQH